MDGLAASLDHFATRELAVEVRHPAFFERGEEERAPNRLLHAPTVALRDAALNGDGELARAAEKLFAQAGKDTPAE